MSSTGEPLTSPPTGTVTFTDASNEHGDLVERERAVDDAAFVERRDRARHLRQPQELLASARDRDPGMLLQDVVGRRLEHAVRGSGLEDREQEGVVHRLEAACARREARLFDAGHAGTKDLEQDRRAALRVRREERIGHRHSRAGYGPSSWNCAKVSPAEGTRQR